MSIQERFYKWAEKNGKTGARLFAISMFLISPYLIVMATWEEVGDDIKELYSDVYKAIKTGRIAR